MANFNDNRHSGPIPDEPRWAEYLKVFRDKDFSIPETDRHLKKSENWTPSMVRHAKDNSRVQEVFEELRTVVDGEFKNRLTGLQIKALDKLEELAFQGENKAVALSALSQILDRALGKPQQSQNVKIDLDKQLAESFADEFEAVDETE